MQETTYFDGGRPLYDDDLETIQKEAQTAATAIFAGLGRDCIVMGCTVAGTVISAGFVYVGGKLLRFLGASNVTFPCSLVASTVAVVLDDRDYEDGINHPAIQEVFAVVQAGVASGVPVYAGGGLTIQHVLRGAQWEVGDTKWSLVAPTDYDGAGLGIPGTAAWGWALSDGQGGRVSMAGQFPVGLDTTSTDYAVVGRTGGKDKVQLSVDEMPSHTHKEGFHITDGGSSYPFKAAHNSGTNNNGKNDDIFTESTGGSQGHENRPPFTVMAVKVWVGF